MTLFLIVAGMMVAAALLFILPPFWRDPLRSPSLHQDAGIYRDQLSELRMDIRSGVLALHEYEGARNAIERRMLDEIGGNSIADAESGTSSKAAAWIVAIAIPVVAVSLYAAIGNPRGLAPQIRGPVIGAAHAMEPVQIATMVDRLAARLRQNPRDREGWVMLARSYSALSRFNDASNAYKKAVDLWGDEASLLADYADTLAMARGRRLRGEPEGLILRALKADRNNIKALALAGSAEFEKSNFGGAVSYWERLLKLVPPESNIARSVRGGIAQAERGKGDMLARNPANTAGAATKRESTELLASVRIDAAVAAKVAPGDTVFIFARAKNGPRMPLAVLRRLASELPGDFRLDDSMAMAPGAKLSDFSQIIISARISKSASAAPQRGDLEGEGEAVKTGGRKVLVVINREIP
jgi:cytochrome c-type biogenesis protein CcmH